MHDCCSGKIGVTSIDNRGQAGRSSLLASRDGVRSDRMDMEV